MQIIAFPDVEKQAETLAIAERFFDSVVLFALFEMGVFTVLSFGPKTLQEIEDSTGGNVESLRATLDAAVAVKVLSKQDGRYAANEALLDCLGRQGSPAYLGEWVAFLHALMCPLAQLGEAIRTGSTPGALFEDMSGDNVPSKRMTAAMDAYARSRGIEIADRLDFSPTRRLLDLGCGPGTTDGHRGTTSADPGDPPRSAWTHRRGAPAGHDARDGRPLRVRRCRCDDLHDRRTL